MNFTRTHRKQLHCWAQERDLLACRYCGGNVTILDGMVRLLFEGQTDPSAQAMPLVALKCSNCGHIVFFAAPRFESEENRSPTVRSLPATRPKT